MELRKDSDKGLFPQFSTPTTDCTEPMDTDNNVLKEQDSEASTTKMKERKSSKATTSNFSQTVPSHIPSCAEQDKEIKKEAADKQDGKRQDFKKTSMSESQLELESAKVEAKSQKMDVCQTTKPSRPSSTPPSSTPPSDAGMMEYPNAPKLTLAVKVNLGGVIILPYNCSKSRSLVLLYNTYLHSTW